MNTLKTGMLLAAMTGLFLAVGWLLGGQSGMLVALALAAGINLFAWWGSDKMVLRMHGAREVDAHEAPRVYRAVEELSRRAGLPMPKVYIIDSPQPNAFATGRNPQNAAVAVSASLEKMLSREELEGVVAHELAHIKNRDTLTMTITATLAGAISMAAHWALFMGRGRNAPGGLLGALAIMILAPLAAMLVQLAISRTREYSADRTGAEISGKPLALASALRRLRNAAGRIDNPRAEANPASAHLFIVNPLHQGQADHLFSTHPKMENRIARLQEMAGRSFGVAASSPIRFGGSFPDQERSALHPLGRKRRGPWG